MKRSDWCDYEERTWMSPGMKLLRFLAMSRTVLNVDDVNSREVYPDNAPIDGIRGMSLSRNLMVYDMSIIIPAGPTPPADGWPVGSDTLKIKWDKYSITHQSGAEWPVHYHWE
jgi:hypothetical protein